MEFTKEAANRLKEEGNALLAAHKFSLAAEKYTEAIELYPTAVYYSNRAQALIKLESYGAALQDANEAIKLDPTYTKAYYRRASSNYVLGKLKDALKDFKAVIQIAPKDLDAQKKYKACEKAMREEAFNKAMEFDGNQNETNVDFNSIVVDSSYLGPRLGDEGVSTITMDFVREMISFLREQKVLHRKYVMQILVAAKALFSSLPSLIRIPLASNESASSLPGHVTVCGDTHGQYYDLLNIFEIGGFPSASNPYLFNGDFVDRGSFSFENVITLISLKLACPQSVHMLRGNHETKNMNKMYGFEGEVKHKYDDAVMALFSQVFNWLPLAAVIQDKVFVVHGGLSTANDGRVTLAEIESLSRNREPPDSGLMSDLLWSDPQPVPGRSPSKRGVGFAFGPDYTAAFLQHNGLQLVVRSHEVKQEGYVEEHDKKCITVFSAPNYCDQMMNKGAFIRFEGGDEQLRPRFTQFEAVPHPNVPPMRYAGNMFGI